MARAVILTSQTSTQNLLFSIPRIPLMTWKLPFMSRQVLCKCSSARAAPASAVVDMAKYKEAFARRMALAGIKPHHRIAIGVSGGPDTMALCVLSAHWKAQDFNAKCDNGGFVDRLLAIIVDHGQRGGEHCLQSGLEDGSYIACCDWPDGHPKQGHLQEAARDMRYEMFQNICIQNRIGVLLIVHHADDQAELFVLRLSRNSSVLGLAAMANGGRDHTVIPIPAVNHIQTTTSLDRRIEETKWLLHPSSGNSSCCIFRVPQHLLEINKKTYLPHIVSIGPYHYGDMRLEMMQQHKWRFFRDLLARTPSNGPRLDHYKQVVASMEENIKRVLFGDNQFKQS